MAGATRALSRATPGDALDLPQDDAAALPGTQRTALTFQTSTAPSADMAAEQRNSEL